MPVKIIKSLERALKELQLIKQGKKKTQSWQEFKSTRLISCDAEVNGHQETKITEGITLMSFKPEYRDAMDKALEEYEKFKEKLPIPPEDLVYSFAYWLFRYSGIVAPAEELEKYKTEAEKIPERCEEDKVCYFELNESDYAPEAQKFIQEYKENCPVICPKHKQK